LSSDSLISVTLKAQVHSVAQIGHLTGNLSRRSVIARSYRYCARAVGVEVGLRISMA
jgi:hypothetical protein